MKSNREAAQNSSQPWQLELLKHSLKKRLKIEALLKILGRKGTQRCLLLTCGDNNGAMNWHLRDCGGRWLWADLEGQSLHHIQTLLDEPVFQVEDRGLPFKDAVFDYVVCIDVLEHLDEDRPLLHELCRVISPGGRALVTVPNGKPDLLANRIKRWVAMVPEVYGHKRAGYTPEQLSEAVQHAGLEVTQRGGYSGFFTEMVELAINFGYVFVLSSANKGGETGIAPRSRDDLKRHGLAYRFYSLCFPLLKWISGLDSLLPGEISYAVIVEAVKPLDKAI